MTNIQPLVIVGSTDAAVCEGDVCEIPAHHDQAVVNRALDSDRV
jgi:hypothetical protein